MSQALNITVGEYVFTIPLDYQGEEPSVGVGSSWFVDGPIVRDDGEEFDEDEFEVIYEEENGSELNWQEEIFNVASDVLAENEADAKLDRYEAGMNEYFYD